MSIKNRKELSSEGFLIAEHMEVPEGYALRDGIEALGPFSHILP